MKRSLKLGIGITSLLLGVVLISSCTASFCSTAETARMMYAGEPGVSQYVTQEEAQNTETSGLVSVEQVFADNPNLYRIVSKDENGGFGRINAHGKVVHGHLQEVVLDLLRMLRIVRQRLGIGNHDEDLVELAAVLQGNAFLERAHVMAHMQSSCGSVSSQYNL